MKMRSATEIVPMMKAVARLFLMLAVLGASVGARAEWPQRPIRVVVPYSAGVGGDLIMRLISEDIGRRLGQPVLVENKEGAGGNLGTAAVAKAAPDGYTFLVAQTSNFVVNHLLYRTFAIDPLNAFAPVILIGNTPAVLVTSANISPNDFRAFASYAKAHQGKVNFGTAGIGTVGQLTLEALNRSQHLGMTSVNYRGAGQVLSSVVSGELDVGFALPGLAAQYIQAGKIRPVAVLTGNRLPSLPDTPSFRELGLDNVGGETWWALVAPAGTPEKVQDSMNAAVREALQAPAVRRQLDGLGIVFAASSRPEAVQKFAREAAHWAQTIRELGVQKVD
jgi:tripartite-type tricarboxylate transporter receptor subunit TctC